MLDQNYFSFIGDLIVADFKEPQTIDVDITFQKANEQEIAIIKSILTKFYAEMFILYNPYEEPMGVNTIPKAPKDWDYWIIKHKDSNISLLREVEIALKLIQTDLTIIFYLNSYEGFSRDRLVPHIFYGDNLKLKEKKLTLNDIEALCEYYSLLKKFIPIKDQYPKIAQALSDLLSLNKLSKNSPFKIIAIFAILELLLTHDNRQKESSITHQLSTKISLLNNRAKNPIVFTKFVKGPDTLSLSKIVELLYKYRSEIAHGAIIDFDSKFNIIKGVEIFDLLFNILKMVIIESLIDPKLVSDLSEC